jgi:hypothetical protein
VTIHRQDSSVVLHWQRGSTPYYKVYTDHAENGSFSELISAGTDTFAVVPIPPGLSRRFFLVVGSVLP